MAKCFSISLCFTDENDHIEYVNQEVFAIDVSNASEIATTKCLGKDVKVLQCAELPLMTFQVVIESGINVVEATCVLE